MRRLDAAVADPDRYNRRVRRLLPLAARTGVVVRRWSWPKGTRAPLAPRELELLEAACRRGEHAESLASLTVAPYLDLAGTMYDAAYPELRSLSPREQHAAKADTCHGGGRDANRDTLRLCGGFPEGGILRRDRFPRWQRNDLALLTQRNFPRWRMPAQPRTTRHRVLPSIRALRPRPDDVCLVLRA